MSKPVVLFNGYDANGSSGLWVTDGTAGGTRKISYAAPYAIVQLGSEVLFFGSIGLGNIGLWVTDGSAAGTSELWVAGNPGGVYISPGSVIVFGSEVLFDRFASFGGGANGNLWVTNGTAAGTFELSVASTRISTLPHSLSSAARCCSRAQTPAPTTIFG
jgi:ELWxxDGT repeat protein